MKLKTLKDLELPCIKDGWDTYIDISNEKDMEVKEIIIKQRDLKKEAIKWIKELEKRHIEQLKNIDKICGKYSSGARFEWVLANAKHYQIDWIKNFFNIKEEE